MNCQSWIGKRLKRTFENILTLTFWTWLAVFVALLVNKQQLDLNFYIFTAAVIGIKSFAPDRAKISPSTADFVRAQGDPSTETQGNARGEDNHAE